MPELFDDQRSADRPDVNEYPLLRYLSSIKDEIARWARPRLIEPAAADDVFGEIYLRCYRYCQKYPVPGNQPTVMRVFISQAVIRFCIDQNRGIKPGRQNLEETIPDVAAQYLIDDAINNELALVDAIKQLPGPYQAPVWLCCVEDLSAKEGAALLGLSLPAFKSRLYRGRNVLRTKLGNAYPLLY